MLVKTSDLNSIKPFLKKIYIPKSDSHKGQNGKVLIIGGSSLFHSASIWAAEVVSHFVDMVHYSSIPDNNEILLSIKKKFRSGIVVLAKNIPDYVEEDDAILIGPGMVRGEISSKLKVKSLKFSEILEIKNEAEYTYCLTKYLLKSYPSKKFVLDAGALQMMDPKWLLGLKTKAIVTPHQTEFAQLFGESVDQYSVEKKAETVQKFAKKYNCVVLLKAIDDFISDGKSTVIVQGGNAGLTKGGTGDVLAGLTTSLYTKNKAVDSCVLASLILKKTSMQLFLQKGYWYNINNIIDNIPIVLNKLIFPK